MKKDQKRADRLARAIEDLIEGRQPDLDDDEELNELLQIAAIRLDAARSSVRAGTEQEHAIWEQIASRLKQLKKEPDLPNGLPNATIPSPENDPADRIKPGQTELSALKHIITLRRQMASDALAISSTHRDAVWQRVQTRIESNIIADRPLFGNPFARPHPQVATFAVAVDRLVLGEPVWEASDSKLEELIRLARVRQAVGQATAARSRDVQGRLWAYLRPRLMARLMRPFSGRPRPSPRQPSGAAVTAHRGHLPKLAVAAAGAAALLVAALGPIPTTGLAHHPAAQLFRFLGEHVGVSETGAPSNIPPPTEIVEGAIITPDQATQLLGLPLRQPSYMPADFQQVSFRYYPQPITADAGGLFALAYAQPSDETADPPTILIYQELASDNAIAVQSGFALDVLLPDATAATYVEGSWQPSGSEIVWGADGAQTLVVDSADLRTIIQYTGATKIDPAQLIAIAGGMTAASPPQ